MLRWAGTLRSEFMYDGLQRRVRLVEQENSVVQSDTKVVWCGKEECEERAADGATVTRRIWGHGEYAAGAARFFAADHVGSVTDVTDGAGAALVRYAFDVWGRRTVVTGTDVTGVGYTSHRWQETGRAWVALYRAYDPDLGRWLSEDPVGLGDGPNLLAYAGNDPVGSYDLFGLTAYRCRRPLGGRGGITRRQERTGYHHEYYCVTSGGVTRCCGQTTDGPGYGPGRPTRPDEGDVLDPEQCTEIPSTECQDRCLLTSCDNARPYYGFVGPGTNCQEWSAGTRNACAEDCRQRSQNE
jgi:RHS repeat-associated protein